MNIFEELLKEVGIPPFVRIRYDLVDTAVDDPAEATRRALSAEGTLDRIRPGNSVCIAVGSREIANLQAIVKALIGEVKRQGGNPFLIPAMGSHGGATAEGQREILTGYGITEEAVGAPVRASMETVEIGRTDSGLPVRIDSFANGADCIIPVGRVKPHTDFRGPVESGLMKMITIGMGKQHGADACHSRGFHRMSQNVREIAGVVIRKKPVIFGLAILENPFHQTYRITAVPGEKIGEEEPKLLAEAKSLMPTIPFQKADALIVDEIGKNISGPGMDPNVTGRSAVMGRWEPDFDAIAVLNVTEQSHHNCAGLGNADVTTRRVFDQFSFEKTYPNSITCLDPVGAKIPAVMPNDRLAVKFALKMCYRAPSDGPRTVWIHNTLSMSSFYISESLIREAENLPRLHVVSPLLRAQFDGDGTFSGWAEDR